MWILTVGLAKADLEDHYAHISQRSMEIFRGSTCEDFISREDPRCRKSSQYKELQEKAQLALEKNYFQEAAESEAENLRCSEGKILAIEKSSEAQKKIARDYREKIPLLKELAKKIRFLEEGDAVHNPTATSVDYDRQMALLRSDISDEHKKKFGLDSNEVAKRKIDEKQKQLDQYRSQYNSLMSSLWMGGTKASLELVQRYVDDKNSDLSNLDQEMPSLVGRLKQEFHKDADDLQKQSKVIAGKRVYDLNSAAKAEVVNSQFNVDNFVSNKELSEDAKAIFTCKLDDRYGRGRDVLKAEVFVGSLFVTGGYSLIARMPVAMRLALGGGTKLGQMAGNASKVLLFGSVTGRNVSMIYEDYRRTCNHDTGFHHIKTGAMCDASVEGQYKEVDEGNCALAMTMDAVSSVSLASLSAVKTYVGSVKLARDLEKAIDYERMSKLSDAERKSLTLRLAPKAFKGLSRAEKEKKLNAVIDAHKVGDGRGFFTYTQADLKKKAEILKDAGFSKEERDLLMRKGVTGAWGQGESYLAILHDEAKRRIEHLQEHVIASVDEAKKIAKKRESIIADLKSKLGLTESEKGKVIEESGIRVFSETGDLSHAKVDDGLLRKFLNPTGQKLSSELEKHRTAFRSRLCRSVLGAAYSSLISDCIKGSHVNLAVTADGHVVAEKVSTHEVLAKSDESTILQDINSTISSYMENAAEKIKLKKIAELISGSGDRTLLDGVRRQLQVSADKADQIVASLLGGRAQKYTTVMPGAWYNRLVDFEHVEEVGKVRSEIRSSMKQNGLPENFKDPRLNQGAAQKYYYIEHDTKFEIILCHKEPCPGEAKVGDVLTAYPVCGPGVFRVPSTLDVLKNPENLRKADVVEHLCTR